MINSEIFPDIQASSYTDKAADLSLTELGRVVMSKLGWKHTSSGKVYDADEKIIGSVLAVSSAMLHLGWIEYKEGEPEYLISGTARVIWARIPSESKGDIDSAVASYQIRYLLTLAAGIGLTNAASYLMAGYTLEAAQKAIESGVDPELYKALEEG